MSGIDKIARELLKPENWLSGVASCDANIRHLKEALQAYGDECAKQMRHDCAHLAWAMSCGGRCIKDVPYAIRALPLPIEKVKS